MLDGKDLQAIAALIKAETMPIYQRLDGIGAVTDLKPKNFYLSMEWEQLAFELSKVSQKIRKKQRKSS